MSQIFRLKKKTALKRKHGMHGNENNTAFERGAH